jgi:hypothetical protein
MGYAVHSLQTDAMPPVFISTGSPRAKVYAWMSLMALAHPCQQKRQLTSPNRHVI